MQKIKIAAFLLALSLLLTGCGSKNFPVQVSGIEIDKKPQHVAVMTPGIAAMAVQLGYSDQIAAVCSDSGIDKLPQVGTAVAPDVEAMIDEEVDLVITTMAFSDDNKIAAEQADIQIVVLENPTSLDGLSTYYQNIAMCFEGKLGDEPAVEEYVDKMERAIVEYQQEQKPTFAIITSAGLTVAGNDTLEGDLFSKVLGQNVAADYPGYTMTLEQLVQANPQVLIVTDTLDIGVVQSTYGLSGLQAVQSGQVYSISMQMVEQCMPQLITQVCNIADKVYQQ